MLNLESTGFPVDAAWNNGTGFPASNEPFAMPYATYVKIHFEIFASTSEDFLHSILLLVVSFA